MKFFIYLFSLFHFLNVSLNAGPQIVVDTNTHNSFINGIENSPQIYSNHDLQNNSLQGSAYELLKNAQSSILILSFTFTDQEVIRIVNQKASEGIDVQLVIDRDHIGSYIFHPSVQIHTRSYGEGHLHHKILVVDHTYVWLGSSNFTPSGLATSKNLAIGFYSPDIATKLHQEALAIASIQQRSSSNPFSCSFKDQLLELYILPHNALEAPTPTESLMNEQGKQKLISLIDNAKHNLKISVDVWTYKDASRAVINAKQRGVKIDIVVGNTTDDAVKLMIQNGISVVKGKDLHYKFMLIDGKTLLNGSPNWSMNAFSRSDESYIVLYNLSEDQMKLIHGVLIAAGLPTSNHFNEKEVLADDKIEVSDQEIHEKIEQVNKTLTALNNEINQPPTTLEHQRLISIAKRLSADLTKFIPNLDTSPVPGCCLYEGDNYLSNVVAIAEKQERVEAGIQYIKSTSGIDQKVHDYFQRTLKKLQAGQNAPLPDYFHASKSGVLSIINSKTIRQSANGLTGPGTYISCNNEGDHGYGMYAFAIDEGCLVDTSAIFRTGRHPITNVFYSLWAAVLMDIPVAEHTIAFIDTSNNDTPNVSEYLQQHHLNIEVFERKISEEILRIFDLTTKRRELPSFFWGKFQIDDYLPQNMYPRSPQGTFRKFTFSLTAA